MAQKRRLSRRRSQFGNTDTGASRFAETSKGAQTHRKDKRCRDGVRVFNTRTAEVKAEWQKRRESPGSDSKMSLREEGRIDCVADLFTSVRMEQ